MASKFIISLTFLLLVRNAHVCSASRRLLDLRRPSTLGLDPPRLRAAIPVAPENNNSIPQTFPSLQQPLVMLPPPPPSDQLPPAPSTPSAPPPPSPASSDFTPSFPSLPSLPFPLPLPMPMPAFPKFPPFPFNPSLPPHYHRLPLPPIFDNSAGYASSSLSNKGGSSP